MSFGGRFLFSDAELAEYAAEDFVGADFAEDGTEFGNRIPQVLCEELCGRLAVKAEGYLAQ